MQKIATQVFIYASVAFGIIGILMIILGGLEDDTTVGFIILQKLLFITICVILPSFALSIAAKYLK